MHPWPMTHWMIQRGLCIRSQRRRRGCAGSVSGLMRSPLTCCSGRAPVRGQWPGSIWPALTDGGGRAPTPGHSTGAINAISSTNLDKLLRYLIGLVAHGELSNSSGREYAIRRPSLRGVGAGFALRCVCSQCSRAGCPYLRRGIR